MRDDFRVSLDGTWDFQINSSNVSDATPHGEWRSAIVPIPWQAQFADLRNTSGVAWYRRHFSIEHGSFRSAAETSAILHFGAVDYHTTVWLNSKLIGEHEGGYLPFEFDLINFLREGDNELLVKVVDPTDDRQRYADFPFSEVPHGKQSWYGPIGGIWQSVWLEFRPGLHLAQLSLNPSPRDATIGVKVVLSRTSPDAYQIRCTVTASDSKVVGSGVFEQSLTGIVHLAGSPQLWSPDSPTLYTLTATLYINGDPIHSIQKNCGFRKIESRDGRIYLNGAPIYLRGVLDQGYYPETIYTPTVWNSLKRRRAQQSHWASIVCRARSMAASVNRSQLGISVQTNSPRRPANSTPLIRPIIIWPIDQRAPVIPLRSRGRLSFFVRGSGICSRHSISAVRALAAPTMCAWDAAIH
jgi:hypothetical protein